MTILSDADRAFFCENGYLVVPDVIPQADCQAVIDIIFDFLGMDPGDPGDWYRSPLISYGLVELYHHQALWNNRQNEKLYRVFAELLGTEKLLTSIDRVSFKPPRHLRHPEYDTPGFIHWDIDTSRLPAPFGVQGGLYLCDTDETMGGFQCIPGFHNELEEWISKQPVDRDPFVPDLANLRPTPIPARAGSVVLWDTRMAHGSAHNVSDKPRFAQFISMFPAERLGQQEVAKRIDDWRARRAPGAEYGFPGDARQIEQRRYATAELTGLGRKLLGLDEWAASPE